MITLYTRNERFPHCVSTMSFPRTRPRLGVTAACVGLLIAIPACTDSTGPSKLEPDAALQSLMLGIGSVNFVSSGPILIRADASFAALAPLLDQVDVTIDGKTQSMFALGMRETFPPGTCMEDVFIFPSFPPEEGVCTPPDTGLGVVLWQSHSAFAPPDRMILIIADIGTVNFDFDSFVDFEQSEFTTTFPSGVAMYLEGEDNFWMSLSGSLTSQVAATSQSCALQLPPYAKAGACSIATFDEQGAITFERFTETGPTAARLTVTIPRQAIHGLWLNITETQPYTFPDFQRNSLTRMLRIKN
jgi:hypothetical protein